MRCAGSCAFAPSRAASALGTPDRRARLPASAGSVRLLLRFLRRRLAQDLPLLLQLREGLHAVRALRGVDGLDRLGGRLPLDLRVGEELLRIGEQLLRAAGAAVPDAQP